MLARSGFIYSDIRHELESLAGSINGRLGELDSSTARLGSDSLHLSLDATA
jgi:hypothetical protein